MTEPFFERLSAMDAAFLEVEDGVAHMHVGAMVILDAQPVTLDHGGLDIDRIRGYIEAAIARTPRYHQRIAWAPMLNHPVWVDDDQFNIHYHIRHTALPRPGDRRLLKRLTARIFSQELDRARPLWEMWIVEGLDNGRFALISKAHHCMVDGVAGMSLMATMLRTSPKGTYAEAPPWNPRPIPSDAALTRAELRQRARGPKVLWDKLQAANAAAPGDLAHRALDMAESVWRTLGAGVQPASSTPLSDATLGPHRRFDVCELPMADVKRVKNALGGKVNDVVLAVVTGAMRRFFASRGFDPNLTDDFRAVVPVSVAVKKPGGKGLGNHVSMMITRLPLSEPDPAKRFREVLAETTRLKEATDSARTGELVLELGKYSGGNLIAKTVRLALDKMRPYNVVVTNVPGPPVPLYLLEARIEEIYPLVPLMVGQLLGIALFSYCGKLFFGLAADWQAVPDLHELVGAVEEAFAELMEVAAAAS